MHTLKKIISGGQTGADRAGLDAAKLIGLQTGGTAPKGWRVCLLDGSDGSDESLKYLGLTEHSSPEYPPRTKQNVLDADGTVWFGYKDSPGGQLTIKCCNDCNKALIINPTSRQLRDWVLSEKISTLNVAGNRLSSDNPTIYRDTFLLLWKAFNQHRPRVGQTYINSLTEDEVVVSWVGVISDRSTYYFLPRVIDESDSASLLAEVKKELIIVYSKTTKENLVLPVDYFVSLSWSGSTYNLRFALKDSCDF
jgi:hypothetical protein